MNRFDQNTGTITQGNSLYANMPLGALTQLAGIHQKRYQDSLNDIENTKGLLKVNADPRNREFRDSWIAKNNAIIDNYAQRAIKEGWTPQLEAEWLSDKNKITNDPNRLAMENAYQNHQLYRKDRVEQEKNNEFINEFDKYTGNGSKDQVTPFDYEGSPKRLQYDEAAKKVVGNIADWGFDNETVNRDPKTGVITSIRSGKEGVVADRLRELSMEKAKDYLETPEGRQYAQVALMRDPNTNIMALLTDKLYTANSQQIGLKTKYNEGTQNGPEWMQDQTNANKTTTRQSEGINNDSVPNIEHEIDLDTKGEIKIPTKGDWVKSPGRTEDGIYDPNRVIYKPNKDKDLNKLKEQMEYIANIQQQHPLLKGLNPGATLKAYQTARKAVSNESIPLVDMSGKAAESIGKSLARNLDGRTYYLYDGTGTTKETDLDNVLKEANISREEFEKRLIDKGVSGYTQAGLTPGAYYMEVGNGRRVMIGAESEIGGSFVISHSINQSRKKLKDDIAYPYGEGLIESEGKLIQYSVLVHPDIQKNGQVSWRYVAVTRDDKGNIIESEKLKLDDLRKQERDNFENSGYLGSKRTIMGKTDAH